MEAERQRDNAWRVSPEGEEAACLARGTSCDGCGFEDRDRVQVWVVGWMAGEEIRTKFMSALVLLLVRGGGLINPYLLSSVSGCFVVGAHDAIPP